MGKITSPFFAKAIIVAATILVCGLPLDAQSRYQPLRGTTSPGVVVNLRDLPPASSAREGKPVVLPRHIPPPYSAAVEKYREEQAAASTLKASEELDRAPFIPEKQPSKSGRSSFSPSTASGTLTENVEGINGGYIPPDPVIAVGPTYVLVAVNLSFAIYDKSGNQILLQSFYSLFSNWNVNSDLLTDPKVIYDQYSQRYVMLLLDLSAANKKGVYLIAASETSDPTGSWYTYSSDATLDGSTPTTYGPDYPGLGYDNSAIYVTSNQCPDYNDGGDLPFEYAKIRIFNKSQLYNNQTLAYTDFVGMSDNYGNVMTIKPAQHFGTTSSAYLLNTEPAGGSSVTLWRIDNPVSSPTLTLQATVSVASYTSGNDPLSIGAVQEGTSTLIDGLDCETQDVVWRNGFLYTAFADLHNWGSGTVEAVHYLKINTSSNAAVIDAIYGADGYYYYDPNIYVDAYGDIAMVFSRSGSTEYPGVRWTYRTASDNAARSSQSLQDGQAPYTTSLAAGYYGHERWGDYSGICLDGSNDNQVWFFGEWAASNTSTSTEVGAFTFPTVRFTNNVGGSAAGGSLQINSTTTISSGSSLHLGNGSNNTELTLAQGGSNRDRFVNTNGVPLAKHNNWDAVASSYLLNSNFTVNGTAGETEMANFIPLNPATVTATVDGSNVSGVQLQLYDPWYLNSNSSQGNNGQAAIPLTQTSSPMTGAYNQGTGGIFTFQSGPSNNWQPPYYSVGLPSQSVSVGGTSHQLYLVNWSASGANIQNSTVNQTGVEFTSSSGATVTANLKGAHLSNDVTAFSDNSARKVVETPDGYMWQTYTSDIGGVSHVFLEYSTDGGSTWQLMKTLSGSAYLDWTGQGKCPSLDWCSDGGDYTVAVVFQAPASDGSYEIDYIAFLLDPVSGLYHQYYLRGTLYTEPSEGDSYSFNANPVIAFGHSWSESTGPTFILAFQRKSSFEYNNVKYSSGIDLVWGYMDSVGQFQITDSSPEQVDSTTSSSCNPTIWGEKSNNNHEFDLAYEQDVSQFSSTIHYRYFMLYNDMTQCILLYSTELSNSSYMINIRPSISGTEVCWICQANPSIAQQCAYSYVDAHRWWYFGNYVTSASINMTNDNSSEYVAWNNNLSRVNQLTNTANPGSIANLNTSGYDVQMFNGATKDDMHVSSYYNQSSSPYYWSTSNALGQAGLGKTSPGAVASGRGCTINDGNANFIYTFGDLNVDGQNVGFVDVPDTAKLTGIDTINDVLLTKPFSLSKDSKVVFTEMSGFADSAASVAVLGKRGFVRYKVDLVDNGTNETVGTLKDVDMNSSNLHSTGRTSYLLDTKNIGNGTYRIRIAMKTSLDSAKFSLVEDYALENLATAAPAQSLTLQDIGIITDYTLSQNYPNPFNPTTTISYTIPKDSHVTLKIYDVLGQVVETLVNADQQVGRYTVNFDGSRLASGVYFYRLVAGNHVITKKMLELK